MRFLSPQNRSRAGVSIIETIGSMAIASMMAVSLAATDFQADDVVDQIKARSILISEAVDLYLIPCGSGSAGMRAGEFEATGRAMAASAVLAQVAEQESNGGQLEALAGQLSIEGLLDLLIDLTRMEEALLREISPIR